MPRKPTQEGGTNGDGIKPLLPFRRPEKMKAIPAKTEIKEATLTRAESYAAWASSLDDEAKISLADVIELALEEVFRRDKNFQKHESAQAAKGDGQPPARPARQSAATDGAHSSTGGATGGK